MSTLPSLSQSRSLQRDAAKIAAAAAQTVRGQLAVRSTLEQIQVTIAAYEQAVAAAASAAIAQMADDAQVQTAPEAFAGVSSMGFLAVEPIIATIDKIVAAPVEAIPKPWWRDSTPFTDQVEQLVSTMIMDTARSAEQVEFTSNAPDWTNYVRMLTPPSCARCVVLAGRVYRDLDEFARHPQCDCVMVPVTDWQDAHDAGLVSSPQEAFDKGHIRGLSAADEKAIRDGANITTVINASHGISSPRGGTPSYVTDLFGHRVKATSYGTTKRAAWRRQFPSRLVRLRPESIYDIATSHQDAIRLLGVYGYLN